MGDSAVSVGGDATTDRAAPSSEQLPEQLGGTSAEAFTDIGLPAEAGWYVSAALYWIAGLAVVLIDQFAPQGTVDPVVAAFGAAALALSPLWLLLARLAPAARWGSSVRLAFPVAFFTVGVFVTGAAINALGLLYLFPLFAVAYMHPPKISVPFCSISIIGIGAAFISEDASATGIASALVMTGVIAALTVGLIASQNRLRRAAAKRYDDSISDPLTGLANLRGLRARLDHEIRLADRDQREVVLFAIDLDDFKEVNDRFSYALGDAVLRAVARAIEEELEPGDLAARRGGDEFAVVVADSPDRHLARLGDRIAAGIEHARRAACPEVNPRASVTRAVRQNNETAEQFMHRVDLSLHMAKVDAHPERTTSAEQPPADEPATLPESTPAGRSAQAGIQMLARTRTERERAQAWRAVAAAALVSAALLCIVVLPGLFAAARNPVTLVAILGLAVIAAACLVAERASRPAVWLHLPIILILLLNIGATAAVGDSAYVLAGLCILPVPLAVIAFGLRSAIPYIAVAGGAYAWFVLSSQPDLPRLQTAVMLIVLLVLSAMLARGRRLADEFAVAAEEVSIVDPLTAAANLRGYKQRVEQEIARAGRTGGELCLVMIDLERFKDVNDRYSHSLGDRLLISTTVAIESVVRSDELVVRRGGDEFVVVSVTPVGREMDALCLRLQSAIRAARRELTPDLALGATVVPVFREDGENGTDLMRRADDALQVAKARERTAAPR
jgi:diguanylate cyclase (GGDEF)-like protein